jgi:uncharacterized protein YuzE
MINTVPLTTYDEEADAAYVQLVKQIPPGGAKHTIVLIEGSVLVDLSDEGHVLGIEILNVRHGIKVRLPNDLEPMLHAAE